MKPLGRLLVLGFLSLFMTSMLYEDLSAQGGSSGSFSSGYSFGSSGSMASPSFGSSGSAYGLSAYGFASSSSLGSYGSSGDTAVSGRLGIRDWFASRRAARQARRSALVASMLPSSQFSMSIQNCSVSNGDCSSGACSAPMAMIMPTAFQNAACENPACNCANCDCQNQTAPTPAELPISSQEPKEDNPFRYVSYRSKTPSDEPLVGKIEF